jgi:hypothetical protein
MAVLKSREPVVRPEVVARIVDRWAEDHGHIVYRHTLNAEDIGDLAWRGAMPDEIVAARRIIRAWFSKTGNEPVRRIGYFGDAGGGIRIIRGWSPFS